MYVTAKTEIETTLFLIVGRKVVKLKTSGIPQIYLTWRKIDADVDRECS
jgi:hypothetical protein